MLQVGTVAHSGNTLIALSGPVGVALVDDGLSTSAHAVINGRAPATQLHDAIAHHSGRALFLDCSTRAPRLSKTEGITVSLLPWGEQGTVEWNDARLRHVVDPCDWEVITASADDNGGMWLPLSQGAARASSIRIGVRPPAPLHDLDNAPVTEAVPIPEALPDPEVGAHNTATPSVEESPDAVTPAASEGQQQPVDEPAPLVSPATESSPDFNRDAPALSPVTTPAGVHAMMLAGELDDDPDLDDKTLTIAQLAELRKQRAQRLAEAGVPESASEAPAPAPLSGSEVFAPPSAKEPQSPASLAPVRSSDYPYSKTGIPRAAKNSLQPAAEPSLAVESNAPAEPPSPAVEPKAAPGTLPPPGTLPAPVPGSEAPTSEERINHDAGVTPAETTPTWRGRHAAAPSSIPEFQPRPPQTPSSMPQPPEAPAQDQGMVTNPAAAWTPEPQQVPPVAPSQGQVQPPAVTMPPSGPNSLYDQIFGMGRQQAPAQPGPHAQGPTQPPAPGPQPFSQGNGGQSGWAAPSFQPSAAPTTPQLWGGGASAGRQTPPAAHNVPVANPGMPLAPSLMPEMPPLAGPVGAPPAHTPGTAYLLRGGLKPVAITEAVVIGRDPDPRAIGGMSEAQVYPVPSPTAEVSRSHCAVFYTQGTWLLLDLGSRNGTFIQRASGVQEHLTSGLSAPIVSGDVIGLGDGVNIEFHVH